MQNLLTLYKLYVKTKNDIKVYHKSHKIIRHKIYNILCKLPNPEFFFYPTPFV